MAVKPANGTAALGGIQIERMFPGNTFKRLTLFNVGDELYCLCFQGQQDMTDFIFMFLFEFFVAIFSVLFCYRVILQIF